MLTCGPAFFGAGASGGGEEGNPDPNFASVVVLAHGDGVNGSTTITNNASGGFALTAGNSAQISTAQSVYGGASILFASVSNSFVRNNTAQAGLGFGTGDFTIEGRIRIGATGQIQTMYDGRDTVDGFSPVIRLDASRVLQYYVNSAVQITGPTIATATWYAIALSRSSGTTRLFVDGVQVGSDWADTSNYPSAKLSLGLARIGSQPLSGSLDEFRITKGVGRYTGTYILKSSAFSDS